MGDSRFALPCRCPSERVRLRARGLTALTAIRRSAAQEDRVNTTMTRADFLRATAAGAFAASLGNVFVGREHAHAGPLPRAGYVVPAGTTLVNPVGTAPTFDQGVAVVLQNDNVTVVNPELRGWRRCLDVKRNPLTGKVPRNVKILFDPAAPGYATSGLYRSRTPILVERVDGLDVGGVNGGVWRCRDCFKGAEILGAQNADFHDFNFAGDAITWGDRGPGYKWGIKVLPDITYGPPYINSNISYRRGLVSMFTDEGLSVDPRGNEPDATPVREADTVKRVNIKRRKVILASPNWHDVGNRYAGYWLVFVSGRARGKMVQITSQSDASLAVADDGSVLRLVAGADAVLIGMPTRNLLVEDNVIDGDRGRVCATAGGFVFDSVYRGNRMDAPNAFRYSSLGSDFGLRDSSRAFQALRIASLVVGGRGSVTGKIKAIPSLGNRVDGNHAKGGDISFHTVQHAPNPTGRRYLNYASANTFQGDAEQPDARLWNDEYNDLR
ncbi:hypothetical protein BH20ACT9_BH20ACT9_20550 [soil metagenome]